MGTVTINKKEDSPSFYSKEQFVPKRVSFLRNFFQWSGKNAPSFGTRVAMKLFTTPQNKTNRAKPDIFKDADILRLPYKDRTLQAYQWGFYGPRVLLVHGWESQAFTFRMVIPELLKKGFSVVAFDAPAHGDSTGSSVNMVEYSESIKCLIDYFEFNGGVQSIIGHSFGAIAASYELAKDDSTTRVNKLVLVSMPTVVSWIIKSFCEFLFIPENIETGMHKYIERRVGASIHDFELAKWGPNMRVEQTLIIHDDEDMVLPMKHVDHVYSIWQTPQYYITHGLGHNKTTKDLSTIHKMVDFLT